ncbi:MAG: class I SAM-dependent methyltransferase [Myxococcota bacterium]
MGRDMPDGTALRRRMADPDGARRRDLLQTLVLVCIGLTPAWLIPAPWSQVWLGVGLVVAAPSVWASWRHAPWVPTPADDVPRIAGALALAPGARCCDLGAGDGRMLVALWRATGAVCDGVEAAPVPWLLGQLRLAAARAPGRLRLGDLYAADLSAYDAVYVWGTAYSVGTERFTARMRATLRPGARIVAYGEPVWGLEPVSVDRSGQRPVRVYVL